MRKNKIAKNIMKCGGNIPVVASIIVLVAFIAGLLLGSLVIAKMVSGKNVFISQMTGSFADGYNAAKSKLAAAGLIPKQVGSLTGKITGISGNEVTFTAALVNPLDNEALKTRVAVIGNDTKIALYRSKTADQVATDQKTGQAQRTDLQNQINSLQAQLAKCTPALAASTSSKSGIDCPATSKDYAAALQKLNQVNLLLSNYVKVDNATLSDVKVGMQITAYGEQNKPTSVPTASSAPAAIFADISEQAKFNASLIEVRETPTAPTVPPGAPAK